MIFKKASFFKIPDALELVKELKNKLHEFPVREVAGAEEFTFGWSPLLKSSELWSIHVENYFLFQAATCRRELSSKVIKRALEQKVDDIELLEGRKVGRKEKADLKDEISYTLLSKAPTSFTTTLVYIDTKRCLLVIDSTADKVIELIFKQLQTTLGSFPMTPPHPGTSPELVTSGWLMNNTLPPSFETGNKVTIFDSSEDKASIGFGGLEPLSEDVTRHLEQGMKVKLLQLLNRGTRFTLDSTKLTLSSIKFDQSLKEDVRNTSEGGKEADMYATLPIMCSLLGEVFDVLAKEFEIEYSIQCD